MAEYEPSTEEVKEFVDSLSGLSADVKAAIEGALAGGTVFAVTEAASGALKNDDSVIVAQNTVLTDVTTGNATDTFVAAEGVSGNVTMTTNSAATAVLDNVNGVNLNVDNAADNNVILINGTASVETGAGDDSFNVQGAFAGSVESGAGDDTFVMNEAAQNDANISVVAGDGFDTMMLTGEVSHEYGFDGKDFTMKSANVKMSGVDVVAIDANKDGVITADSDYLHILSTNAADTLVGKLYKVALGREAIDSGDGSETWQGHEYDTLAGINWWMNEFEKQDDEGTTEHLYKSFLNCAEFHNKYDDMSDSDYVATLLANAGLDGSLAASYLAELDGTDDARYNVAFEIANSVEIVGKDGQDYVIEGYVLNA